MKYQIIILALLLSGCVETTVNDRTDVTVINNGIIIVEASADLGAEE